MEELAFGPQKEGMNMDRRDFLKFLTVGVASSLIKPDPLKALTLLQQNKPVISVVHGENIELAVRKAVELIGGMNSFVAKGDVVFVKPNMSWDRIPAQAATTNPEVVSTIIKMALEAGAKKVIVADNTCNDARRSYTRSGIKEAAEKSGAKVYYTEERKFVKTNLKGEVIGEWPVYREALEADRIINIPIAKHHGLTRVTLSMKNLMGLIGGKRNRLHQNIDHSIVDLTAFFKPVLTVLDSVRVLKANGPQGGSLKDVEVRNTIAASKDPVRIDAFGASIFGITPEELKFLKIAETRGLGSTDFKGTGYSEVTI